MLLLPKIMIKKKCRFKIELNEKKCDKIMKRNKNSSRLITSLTTNLFCLTKNVAVSGKKNTEATAKVINATTNLGVSK